MPPEQPPIERPPSPVPLPVVDADLHPERECPEGEKVEADQASVDHDFAALVRSGALEQSGPDELASPAWPAQTSWTRLSDVAGLRTAKRLLIRRVRRVLGGQHSRVPAAYHLLFYGPPGCGKSLLARAVAGELGARFTHLDAAALSRVEPADWSAPGGLFEPSPSPALRVIFIDGLDALPAAQAAGLASAISLPTNDRSPVVVVAATERIADVAPVLRTAGTFAEPIFVGPPRRAARMLIFAQHLQGRVGCTVSLKQLAACTPGLTGADIASICRRAADRVLIETRAGGRPRPLEMIDLVVQNALTPRILPDWRREQLGLRKRRR